GGGVGEHLVDGDDALSAQRCGEFHLAEEAGPAALVMAIGEGDALDGDEPSGAGLAGLVHHALGASAEALEQLVLADGAKGRGGPAGSRAGGAKRSAEARHPGVIVKAEAV